jgi:hypothetical protein
MLIIFFGMTIVCASMDYSFATKASWFLVFLCTGPLGSVAYYFAVYRGQVARSSAPKNHHEP